jgi:hypothetical protein
LDEVQVNTEDYSGSQMILADADNAMAAVLSENFPPTEMVIHVSKARDDQGHQGIRLLFDGAIGRVYDRDISEGEVRSVDEILYNRDITEEQLNSDGDLFATIEKEKDTATSDEVLQDASESVPESSEIKSVEIKPQTLPEVDKGKKDDLFDDVVVEEKPTNAVVERLKNEIFGENPQKDNDKDLLGLAENLSPPKKESPKRKNNDADDLLSEIIG